MKQFNALEVKCNGIGGYGYQAARKHNETILNIVNEVRNALGLEGIWQKIMELDSSYDYHQGRRFLDPESNAKIDQRRAELKREIKEVESLSSRWG